MNDTGRAVDHEVRTVGELGDRLVRVAAATAHQQPGHALARGASPRRRRRRGRRGRRRAYSTAPAPTSRTYSRQRRRPCPCPAGAAPGPSGPVRRSGRAARRARRAGRAAASKAAGGSSARRVCTATARPLSSIQVPCQAPTTRRGSRAVRRGRPRPRGGGGGADSAGGGVPALGAVVAEHDEMVQARHRRSRRSARRPRPGGR